ncbi:MAG: glycosyltransferase [Phycisphaerae bacterium]|nr:glycosyltransferase [Phycisphaerae bacterium]
MLKSDRERRRVLVVAPLYYPDAGIGSHRAGKLVRYLGQFGWQPTVLTLREEYYRYCHPVVDPALRFQIPPGTEVVRTHYASVVMLRPLVRRLQSPLRRARPAAVASWNDRASEEKIRWARWIEVPDFVGWLPFGIIHGLRHARRCDVVWATSPPTGGVCLGAVLARLTGRPFVADFRDPWSAKGVCLHATRFHAGMDRSWEGFVLATAARIAVVTKEMAEDLARLFPAYAHKIHVIYNGYDPEDFSLFADRPARCGPIGEVSVGYLGTLYQGRQQFMRRFLEGVREFNAGSGEFKVRVVVRGPAHEDVAAQARAAGIEQTCDIGPPVPYREALRLMSNLDVMLVVGAEAHGHALTGKVFEYIGARKPILAVTPEGALSRFVRENRIGAAVEPATGGQVADAIRDLVSRYPEFAVHLDAVAVRFTRQEIARQTARLLDEAVDEAVRPWQGGTR